MLTVAKWEYGAALLVDENPDVYEVRKGPWREPREVDEGYVLMCRQVSDWSPAHITAPPRQARMDAVPKEES